MISDTCMSDFFIRERRRQCENRCKGETEADVTGRQQQRLEGCGHKSGKAWGPPKMEEARMDSEIINSYC